ncbi:hypothetical protein [Burkholderia pyrrocinia]
MRIDCKVEPLDGERLQEARAVFEEDAAMRAKTNTGGTVDGAIIGGAFFRVYADGEPVAWYVLQPFEGVAEIAAAYGRAEVDLVATVLPVIERQCEPFGAVCVTTKRRGLIKKLETAGYRRWRGIERGIILRKDFQ